jgi:hypothetical protein
VSNEVTVLRLAGREAGWLLVTSDTRQEFSRWPIVAYHSTHPTWSGPVPVYDPPEAGGNRYAYNPTLIPLTDTSYVLAYNVNSALAEITADPAIYRPRFRLLRISHRR